MLTSIPKTHILFTCSGLGPDVSIRLNSFMHASPIICSKAMALCQNEMSVLAILRHASPIISS